MDEMIYDIEASFTDTKGSMQGVITVDGVTTFHQISKSSTTEARAAVLIMMADALGYKAAEVINFDSIGINKEVK